MIEICSLQIYSWNNFFVLFFLEKFYSDFIYSPPQFKDYNEPTEADVPDTQVAKFITSLISTTVFSCANIIGKGFFLMIN